VILVKHPIKNYQKRHDSTNNALKRGECLGPAISYPHPLKNLETLIFLKKNSAPPSNAVDLKKLRT